MVFQDARSLLSAHSTYWIEGGSLVFAIPVPLIQAEAELVDILRLEDVPSTIRATDGLQVLFESEHRYIAVANDK